MVFNPKERHGIKPPSVGNCLYSPHLSPAQYQARTVLSPSRPTNMSVTPSAKSVRIGGVTEHCSVGPTRGSEQASSSNTAEFSSKSEGPRQSLAPSLKTCLKPTEDLSKVPDVGQSEKWVRVARASLCRLTNSS
jgi:hypothetical protein